MIIITGGVTGTPETIDAVRAHFAVPASAEFVRTATALASSPPSLELFTATPASL
jgi:hypothetical protein